MNNDKSKELAKAVEAAARALSDLNTFAAVVTILEGGHVHSESHGGAERIIAICKSEQAKRLREYDRANGIGGAVMTTTSPDWADEKAREVLCHHEHPFAERVAQALRDERRDAYERGERLGLERAALFCDAVSRAPRARGFFSRVADLAIHQFAVRLAKEFRTLPASEQTTK